MTTNIVSQTTQPEVHIQDATSLIQRSKSVIKKLQCLFPTNLLDYEPSSKFGRNIEKELNNLNEHNGVMMLRLRKQDTAVVMSVEHYETILQMKETCAQLLAAERDSIITKATDDYEALYSRITSQKTRRAADTLFSASAENLSESYQPGKTETT